jgi:hypothetical protein
LMRVLCNRKVYIIRRCVLDFRMNVNKIVNTYLKIDPIK